MNIRSGIGYDIHRIKVGNSLYIGGIKISDEYGAVAHSDGDVLIHALIDSLLGAIGESDIGTMFPDSEDKFKDISSIKLLDEVKNMIDKSEFKIVNIDSVIIAEKPKLSKFRESIITKITNTLKIDKDRFNIKAKTAEGLGETGKGNAIECYCICMVRK